MSIYNKYSCQVCGLTVQSGRKYFLLPDDLMISIVYVFRHEILCFDSAGIAGFLYSIQEDTEDPVWGSGDEAFRT